MAHVMRTIRKWELAFDEKAERFVYQHPSLGFAGLFLGVPVFTLLAVSIGTTVAVLPISWILSWL